MIGAPSRLTKDPNVTTNLRSHARHHRGVEHPQRTASKTSVMIVSSAMPPPAALGCCAPDLGSPYIASIVRRMFTCVMPLPSAYEPGLICAPAKIVTMRFPISRKSWLFLGEYLGFGPISGLVSP